MTREPPSTAGPVPAAGPAGPWKLERWLSDEAARAIEYSEYWNDETAERGKPFDVAREGFEPLERYLAEVGLLDDLAQCVSDIERHRGRPLGGAGIDLAAGALWAAPRLLAAGPVDRLWCLEYSWHRLVEAGPQILAHFDVSPERIVLAYGSFYDLRLPDGSLDFAFMSQALHHADRPGDLLEEIRRVLKPGGVVIVVGEHLIPRRQYAIYAARASVSALMPAGARARYLGGRAVKFSLRPRGADLSPPDPILGDHSYTLREYGRTFEEHGFGWRRLRRREGHYQSFVLERR